MLAPPPRLWLACSHSAAASEGAALSAWLDANGWVAPVCHLAAARSGEALRAALRAACGARAPAMALLLPTDSAARAQLLDAVRAVAHRRTPSLASSLRVSCLRSQAGGQARGAPPAVADSALIRALMRGEADAVLVGQCLLLTLPHPDKLAVAGSLAPLLPVLRVATAQLVT